MTAKTATKTRHTPETEADANGNGQITSKRQPTLEELSLKAYRLTHERLYGKRASAPRKTQTSTAKQSIVKLP